MAYPNLVAEMARIGITEKDLAAVAEKSPDTIRNWLRGKTEIPFGKAIVIRDRYFPQTTLEYLYSPNAVPGMTSMREA